MVAAKLDYKDLRVVFILKVYQIFLWYILAFICSCIINIILFKTVFNKFDNDLIKSVIFGLITGAIVVVFKFVLFSKAK
jgi:hypothetical protein